ncbi:hypothetical protein D3C87_1842570 [compost metagenome]
MCPNETVLFLHLVEISDRDRIMRPRAGEIARRFIVGIITPGPGIAQDIAAFYPDIEVIVICLEWAAVVFSTA